ncbi:C2 domain-containing protein [Psidium guajava]|nr:C2 domain-containing protein [Psidium guajava]
MDRWVRCLKFLFNPEGVVTFNDIFEVAKYDWTCSIV